MSLVTRKPVFGVFDQVRLKPAQPQKLTRGLKFRKKKLEILYYLGSENKCADQTARMRAFLVCIGQTGFLMTQLICQ